MNTNLTINTSKIRGYKNKILAISLIAIFAISIVMAFAPTASAQIGITQPRQTTAFLSVAPMTVGTGQTLTVNLWVCPVPSSYALGPAFFGYKGITITFTKPDGTTDTFMPTDGTVLPAGQTEALGTIYFYYTPNQVGTWKAQFTMPAQNYTDFTGTVQYTSCTSSVTTFTVQSTPVDAGIVNGYPWAPLPTGYWSYPINSNNREWAAISGNWLNGPGYPGGAMAPTKYQPYGAGPTSDHILWDNAQAFGGLVGGYMGSVSYSGSGVAATAAGAAPIIMNGNVYYNLEGGQQWTGVSLTTGKTLFTANGQITFGIDLPGNAYSQGIVLAGSYGAYPGPYLVYAASGSSSWIFYDPVTGALMRTITGVPQPVIGYQQTAVTPYPIAGSLTSKWFEDTPMVYGYFQSGYNQTAGQFAQSTIWAWNMTKVTGNVWNTGLMWNTSVNSPGHPNIGDGPGRSGLYITPDLTVGVLCEAAGGENRIAGYDLTTGRSIWNVTTPFINEYVMELNTGGGIIMNWDPTFQLFYGYNMHTGALMWTSPKIGTYPWGTFYSTFISGDNIYLGPEDGYIYCLSATTGALLWTSNFIENTTEQVAGQNYVGAMVEASGIVYAYYGYSIGYEQDPIARYNNLVAINATNGDFIWELPGGVAPLAVSSGYLIGHGQNDGNIYCLGKGQTSTSVTVQNDVVTEGATVLIKGNVLDQSPAQPGTPAVSDASISEQMDYLHMQNATLISNPPQEQGVPVTLTAVDPNMNTVVIGTTTTNAQGNYGFNYVPPRTGMYTITANFAGSNSYWRSTAQTMITVTTAAATTTSTSTSSTTSSDVTTPILMAAIAIIIAIVIVGAALFLLLRKRP